MGYRSDLKIALRKQEYGELKNEIDKLAVEKSIGDYEQVKHLMDYATIEESEKVVVIGLEDVKWYYEFSEVQFMKDFLYQLDEQGKPYKFVRIGEHVDDISVDWSAGNEDDYSCFEAIQLVRKIETHLKK